MPTPRGEYWRLPGATVWRRHATDPAPAPPTAVEWLARPLGVSDGQYMQQVALGALPSLTAPQDP